MKYRVEEYEDSGFYGCEEDEVENYKQKVVKCRKAHECASCQKEIETGEYALSETGFMDGEFVSCYTCIDCLDKWLDRINGCDDDAREAHHD